MDLEEKNIATAADNQVISDLLAETLAEGLETVDPSPVPDIQTPGPEEVTLYVGIEDEDGVRRTDAVVRELTGHHEERLSKVSTDDVGKWVQTLLECGTVSIGGVKATPSMLLDLKVGDRDQLALAISRATFGDRILFDPLYCDTCDEAIPNAEYDLSTLPEGIKFSGEEWRTVTLPSGRRADYTFPNGSDQLEHMKNPDATIAEKCSLIMYRCTEVIYEKDGTPVPVVGNYEYIRNLSVRDRNALTNAIAEDVPGPRYNELDVKLSCGHDLRVSIGLMHLFRGLW